MTTTTAKMKIVKVLGHDEIPGGTCDHCGTGIKYQVTILLEDGSNMRIGRTCAQKLTTDREVLRLIKKGQTTDGHRGKILDNHIRRLEQEIDWYGEREDWCSLLAEYKAEREALKTN